MKKLFNKIIFLGAFSLLIPFSVSRANEHVDLKEFGGWSIEQAVFDLILNVLPVGKTVLEFGSGWASGKLSKYYTVYSIEHDANWLDKYDTTYIYAPIKNGWYDTDILKKQLPQKYDLILVDGPPGYIGRSGFFTNSHLFNLSVPIIFDDIQRPEELTLMIKFAQLLNRTPKIFNSGEKQFGILMP